MSMGSPLVKYKYNHIFKGTLIFVGFKWPSAGPDLRVERWMVFMNYDEHQISPAGHPTECRGNLHVEHQHFKKNKNLLRDPSQHVCVAYSHSFTSYGDMRLVHVLDHQGPAWKTDPGAHLWRFLSLWCLLCCFFLIRTCSAALPGGFGLLFKPFNVVLMEPFLTGSDGLKTDCGIM